MLIKNFQSFGFVCTFPSNSNFTFLNSIFTSIIQATPISIDNIDADLRFIKVLFEGIKGNKEGGAIHAYSPSKHLKISLSQVIAQSVSTSNNQMGSFAYIETIEYCEISDSSFSNCAPKSTSAHYFFYLSSQTEYLHGGNITHGTSYSDHLFIKSSESVIKCAHFQNCTVQQHGIVVFVNGENSLALSTFIDHTMIRPNNDASAIMSYIGSKLTIRNIYVMKINGKVASASGGGFCKIYDSVVDDWKHYGVSIIEGIVNEGTRPPTLLVYPLVLIGKRSKNIKIKTKITISFTLVNILMFYFSIEQHIRGNLKNFDTS